jgi:hypothetical protein
MMVVIGRKRVYFIPARCIGDKAEVGDRSALLAHHFSCLAPPPFANLFDCLCALHVATNGKGAGSNGVKGTNGTGGPVDAFEELKALAAAATVQRPPKAITIK